MNRYKLKKANWLDKKILDSKMYFPSLLEHAYANQLLTDSEVKRIKQEIYQLLSQKIKSYTANQSSSVPVETAAAIMQSNLYTIGLALKKFPTPEEALQQIKTWKLLDIYQNGRTKIDNKMHTAKFFHLLAKKNALQTQNITYTATLLDGIDGFFKLYQADFEAHEIHITLDYPLGVPVTDKIGIELMVHYLERIYIENMFCTYFSISAIESLLYHMDKQYMHHVLNIFTVVFTQVLGCMLAKTEPSKLQLISVQIEEIYRQLHNKSMQDVYNIFKALTEEIIARYQVSHHKLKNYLLLILNPIVKMIYQAVQLDTLEKCFIPYHEKAIPPNIMYQMGLQMDNETYRQMVDELLSCRFSSDKIAWIQNEVQSLADLESIICDAKLTAEEIQPILDALPAVELAVLCKRNLTDAFSFTDEKSLFQQCLQQALTKRSEQEQWRIQQYINSFIIQP